jgi:hypothetical protein
VNVEAAEARQPSAIAIAARAVLTICPETWRRGLAGAILTAHFGMALLFIAVRGLVRVLLPPVAEEEGDPMDSACSPHRGRGHPPRLRTLPAAIGAGPHRADAVSDAPGVEIRRATAADLPAVLHCLRAAFAPYEKRYTPAAFEDTVMTAESAARRIREMTVLVAVDEAGAVIGTIAFGATLGCSRVTLDTTEPLARAIAFHRRCGHAPTGVVRDFYGMPLMEYAKHLASPQSRGAKHGITWRERS